MDILDSDNAADIPIQQKVAYVMRQGQDRDHTCHWPGCTVQCRPAFWGCRKHWYMLPKHLRDAIWQAYRPGQEVDATPSQSYMEVARKVREWIHVNYPSTKTN
jgi:hypothetical protein